MPLKKRPLIESYDVHPHPQGEEQPKTELTSEEIKAKHGELWEEGDKIGSLETVLGQYVNAEELADNPILQTVISADAAYGAALMLKTIEEMHDQQS